MAEIVTMPRLSDTMTEGVVSKWHKKVGDSVNEGDLLADIETDKATMEFESFQEGFLLYIGINEGEKAPVDSILAILGDKNEDYKKILDEFNSKNKESLTNEKQNTKDVKVEEVKVEEVKVEEVKVEEVKDKLIETNQKSNFQNKKIKASPLARKLAEEKNIDISLINGTGDGNRIIKRDIDNFSILDKPNIEKFTDIPVSQMRNVIAKRLSESKFTAPHFYLTVEINMDNIINTREAINKISKIKISFNDMIIQATAHAILKHPEVNASWHNDFIRFNQHVHIGVAMAVEDGLLVPVVRFADNKKLSQIASEVQEYGKKAKAKKLQPEDWQGNTFTISNLGMFGVEEFTAIINTPDSCILAIGGIIEKPIIKKRNIIIGNTMKVTLSCDHRVVDGVVGSKFLNTLKYYLENPVIFLGAKSI